MVRRLVKRQVDTILDEYYEVAIKRITNGEKLRAVVRDLGLPRSTLQGRLNGAQTRLEAAGDRLRLSPEAEALFVNWILAEEAAGNAPSLPRIAELAEGLLAEAGSHEVLGKHWPQRFVERYEELLQVKRGRLVDIERISAVCDTNIVPFFVRLGGLIKALNLSLKNIWNIDKTGT